MNNPFNTDLEPEVIGGLYRNVSPRKPRGSIVSSSREVGRGGAKFMGYTESAGAPTTAQLPEDKSWCIHKNTAGPTWYVAFNAAGTIKSVVLA